MTLIAQTPEMVEMLPTLGMPTTYFVDSEGRVLTVPVRGADFEGYSEKLEQALKAVELQDPCGTFSQICIKKHRKNLHKEA